MVGILGLLTEGSMARCSQIKKVSLRKEDPTSLPPFGRRSDCCGSIGDRINYCYLRKINLQEGKLMERRTS
jgi:hypothetical protein